MAYPNHIRFSRELTISPLLWDIYYDPMFAKINQLTNLYFTSTTYRIKNILHRELDSILNCQTSLVGYLDSTTWLASSIDQITEKLTIVNSFYSFAKIKINTDKYKILTNQNKLKSDLPPAITLNINNTHACERPNLCSQ